MNTYLVRCSSETEARTQLLVRAGDAAQASAKAERTPLFRSLALHVDQVIDEALMCQYLMEHGQRHLRDLP